MFNSISGRVVAAIKKALTEGGLKLVRLNVNEVFGSGNLSSMDIINPYGVGNIPPNNTNVFLTSVNNSSKCLFATGGVTAIPRLLREPVQGESWSYSQKYALVYQNDGIKAYRQADTPDFACTLPNGEAFVQMMVNRIAELEAMVATINSNYTELKSAWTSHTHSGVTPGGGNTGGATSALTQNNIVPLPTQAKDKAYLMAGKALIDDLGEVYT